MGQTELQGTSDTGTWTGAGRRQGTFATLAFVAALGFSLGCESDGDKTGSSAAGQSCARTADCASGLVCIDNRCATSGAGSDAGGVTPAPALGGLGESCTRRADCQPGFSCLSQRCTAGSTPEMDAGTPPGPRLGLRGESCEVVSDCQDGLTCVARPSGGGGVCDYEAYGLMPTGNLCSGECKTAADCCQLPPNGFIAGGRFVRSCADLRAALIGDPATACTEAGSISNQTACFYLATYCDCAANTWACEANRCAYTAPCERSGEGLTGCAARSRSGTLLSTSCNAETKTCGQAAPQVCTSDAECVGKAVSDDPSDNCTAGECRCVQMRCYRRCDNVLDCARGFTCDTVTSQVCVAGAKCTRNEQCAVSLRDVRAVCKEGECALPCSSDRECSPSGSSSGLGLGQFTGMVCSMRGVCEALGCASDDECNAGNSSVRTFCLPAAAAATSGWASAISD